MTNHRHRARGKAYNSHVAIFITCIGSEGLEVYNGLPIKDEKEKNDPRTILKLLEEYLVGKTNTIYIVIFHNKHQDS